MHLAVCHTVITQDILNDAGEKILNYSASSPDELALVNAARFFGYTFLGWDED